MFTLINNVTYDFIMIVAHLLESFRCLALLLLCRLISANLQIFMIAATPTAINRIMSLFSFFFIV